MKNLEGKKWGSLSEEVKQSLLIMAEVCNDANGEKSNYEVIVDLDEELSVAGKIIDDEIVIEDDAIIYNSIG